MLLLRRSPVHKSSAAVSPATTIGPSAAVGAIAPGGAAVAPFIAALAVFPLAGASAVFEFMAAAVAPFALGHELTIEFGGLEQRAPAAIANVFDARIDAVALVWGAEGGGGFCALAENSTGGDQSLEGDQGTFHLFEGIWALVARKRTVACCQALLQLAALTLVDISAVVLRISA